MSDNIDDIAEEIIPVLVDPVLEEGSSYARYKLKQAFTEGKLVVPLSVEQMVEIINKVAVLIESPSLDECCLSHWKCSPTDLSKAIYDAQYKKGE